jgi:general secretion pathway protein D
MTSLSRLLSVLALVALLAPFARAQTPPPPPAPAAGPGGTTPPAPATPAPDADDGDLYKCKKYPPNAKIRVTLKPETDVKDLVTWAMGFTCRNFIYGNAITGRSQKVTIIAPTQMSPADAYRLFLVSLQSLGLTLVPKGNTIEIVESPKAQQMPLPMYKSGKATPSTDQIVRAVFRPEYVSPEDLATVLGTLVSPHGKVQPLAKSGVVLVTDYGTHIDRMVDLLREVDQASGGEKVFILYLQYASVSDIVPKVSEVFGVGKAGATPAPAPAPGQAAPAAGGGGGRREGALVPSKIIPDERTNSLIVVGSERAYARLVAFVRRIDVPEKAGDAGSIFVYALKNADAEELAATLNSLISGQQQRPSSNRPGGAPGQPQAPAPSPTPAAGAGGGVAFEGTVRVTFDKPTNALVITSSARDYLSMREVIDQLDSPRRQVYVEATILEISLDKGRQVGFTFHGGKNNFPVDEALTFGASSQGPLSSLALGTNPESLATLGGLVGGILGPELNIPALGLTIPSIGLLFQLKAQSSDVNVLSAPHMLTMDNQPTEIRVGTNVPYKSGISAIPGAAGSAGFPLQNIQREKAELKLKLTPHVNESGFIRLEFDLDIADIAANDPELGPTLSTRAAKTTVVVKDQQPVVIGGLMQEKVIKSTSKVPILGDIPLLGYLFRYSDNRRVKVNLLIFLTPYVVRDQTDIQRIYEQKVREQDEFMSTFSALASANFDPKVNYARKRGLLEEINQAVKRLDEDDKMLRAADEAMRRRGQEGAIEMPDEPPADPKILPMPPEQPPTQAPPPSPKTEPKPEVRP